MNARIVVPGTYLYVRVRRATISGPGLTPDLLQSACSVLRNRHGLAAVPIPGEKRSLWVASSHPIPALHLEGEDWQVDVADAGGPECRLAFANVAEREILSQLIERAIEVTVARGGDLWRIDSPRIWYEATPFTTQDGIAAYRRYEISAEAIDDVGIGVAVDIGTAFFTEGTLAYFFDTSVPSVEQRRREDLFNQLTSRQKGQKGTLLYDTSRSHVVCYFAESAPGVTCGTTGTIRARGKSYDSLLDYYHAENPDLPITAASSIVRVSFRGIPRPQPVAAERLRVRVMNDDVPDSLSSCDKIAPDERRTLIRDFWDRLGHRPFGKVAPGVFPGFWRPSADRIVQIPPPGFVFGAGHRLLGSAEATVASYQESYRRRVDKFFRAGCYSVPPTMPRSLFVAFPKAVDQDACEQLASDVADTMTTLSRCEVSAQPVAYDSIDDAIAQLRAAASSGLALIVLDEEPAAYHEVAFQLQGWRIKRITEQTLLKHNDMRRNGVYNRRTRSRDARLGQIRWQQFVQLNVLDLLQLADAVPFRPIGPSRYEAQLAIDVGHDRHHVALSLLIVRDEHCRPDFAIVSEVQRKPDHQHEMINSRLLKDHIVRIVRDAIGVNGTPIGSLLVTRDGRAWESEGLAIDEAVRELKSSGHLGGKACVDVVEIHKDTLRSLRVWDLDEQDSALNPPEASLIMLNRKMALVLTTGAATLHQGTADPLLVVGNGRCSSVVDAGVATIEAAQLNWSSPAVSQRLPLHLKRTDEELRARAAQEIRRLN